MRWCQPRERKGCEYLGRIPSNVKFINETQLEDGSYQYSGQFLKRDASAFAAEK